MNKNPRLERPTLFGPTLRRTKAIRLEHLDALRRKGTITEKDIRWESAESDAALVIARNELWLEAPLGNQWVAAYRVVRPGGIATFGELRVFPAEPLIASSAVGMWSGEWLGAAAPVPSGGITANLVKGLRIGKHRDDLHRTLEQLAGVLKAELPPHEVRDWFLSHEIQALKARARVRRVSKADLALCASAYVTAMAGGSRHPNRDVAATLGISERLATMRIMRARDEGILTRESSGQRGRSGGQLTEWGRRIIKAIRKQQDQPDTLPDTLTRGRVQKRRTQADAKSLKTEKTERSGRRRTVIP